MRRSFTATKACRTTVRGVQQESGRGGDPARRCPVSRAQELARWPRAFKGQKSKGSLGPLSHLPARVPASDEQHTHCACAVNERRAVPPPAPLCAGGRLPIVWLVGCLHVLWGVRRGDLCRLLWSGRQTACRVVLRLLQARRMAASSAVLVKEHAHRPSPDSPIAPLAHAQGHGLPGASPARGALRHL